MVWGLSIVLFKLNELKGFCEIFDGRWHKKHSDEIELGEELENLQGENTQLEHDLEQYKTASLEYERLAGQRAEEVGLLKSRYNELYEENTRLQKAIKDVLTWPNSNDSGR